MAKENEVKSFVTTVDLGIAGKLRTDLEDQGFTLTKPAHTIFSGKKKGLSCTLYESGKLLVQGKETPEFMEFYLEPEILRKFVYTYSELSLNTTPHIGIDESGKGDFFGPLCIAGVYADGKEILRLKELGVKDSKAMTDSAIHVLANKIKKEFTHHIVRINPLKYNELYAKFRNLNHLLAWGHATTIESLVEKSGCRDVIIDQFAAEQVVETALKRKSMEVKLTQRHRGEEDLVVAAASILARQAFLDGLAQLSSDFSIPLPKGASPKVVQAGIQFASKYGRDALPKVGKMHFKTLDAILAKHSE